jgi:uncharacterized protein (TIGR00290 family)
MYAASWSGGKDSCLAYYRALQRGYQVECLLNTISETSDRVRFHGVPKAFIAAQAEALGVELLQPPTPDDDYEGAFKAALRSLLPRGLEGVVFGDIYVDEHREWCCRVCSEVGVEAIHPLWAMRSEDVVDQLIADGFEALVVSGHPDYLTEAQMGAQVTPEFIAWCASVEGLDVCGEKGEYHTVVVDGPVFQRRIAITDSRPVRVDGHCFLDIRSWTLTSRHNRTDS